MGTPAHKLFSWVVCGFVWAGALGAAAGWAGQRPPAAALLPENTAVLVCVLDGQELVEGFRNTGFGQLLRDPSVKPLVDHVYGTASQAVDQAREQLGLSLDELLAIPQGELAFAVIVPQGQPPQIVVLISAEDQMPNLRKLLRRGAEGLERAGADRSVEMLDGTRLVRYQAPGRRPVAWFEKDGTLAISSDVGVLKDILAVWNGEKRAVLGNNKDFAAIMRRSGGQSGRPQVMWYVDPIGLLEGIARENPGAQVGLSLLPTLGLDGIQAAGGTVLLDAEPFDWLVRAHLLLSYPRDGLLELLAFGSGPLEPQLWVPADVATYMTLYVDLPAVFRTVRTLVDGFRGEGTFDLFFQRRIEDQIDVNFEKEILPVLSGRITLANRVERPVTLQSRGTLVGLGLTDPKTAGAILEKVVDRYQSVLVRRSLGRVRYVRFEPIRTVVEERQAEPRYPCFGILGDSFVVADRESLFRAAVASFSGAAGRLADEEDFRQVSSLVYQKAPTPPAAIQFRRPSESFRLAYQALSDVASREPTPRRGARIPVARALNAALQANPLPPYDVVAQYLTPGGAVLTDDQAGIHYMVFSLKKSAAEAGR